MIDAAPEAWSAVSIPPTQNSEEPLMAPADATLVAGNSSCVNGILSYGNRFLTVQAHPEHEPEFTSELIRRKNLTVDGMLSVMTRIKLFDKTYNCLMSNNV